jgi:CDP-diacylglycerol--glycerol-3-phosphate 3-phosphatidyltransferase
VWAWVKRAYLRLVDPIADTLVARGVHPNTITTIGLGCTLVAGAIFADGHISIGGWFLGLTAVFDVLDGLVARKSGRASTFGAFYDSTLDRIADGAILGGLAVFWATDGPRHSVAMVVVCLGAIVGSYLTSYTRARAEGLGLDAKVGLLQRTERVVLLSAPQAFFGLALDGLILKGVVVLFALTSWITVVQRVSYVHAATNGSR